MYSGRTRSRCYSSGESGAAYTWREWRQGIREVMSIRRGDGETAITTRDSLGSDDENSGSKEQHKSISPEHKRDILGDITNVASTSTNKSSCKVKDVWKRGVMDENTFAFLNSPHGTDAIPTSPSKSNRKSSLSSHRARRRIVQPEVSPLNANQQRFFVGKGEHGTNLSPRPFHSAYDDDSIIVRKRPSLDDSDLSVIDRKRSHPIHIYNDEEDSEVFFPPDDVSPNSSIASHIHPPLLNFRVPLLRAISSGALEMGQFAKRDENLPKVLEVVYRLPVLPPTVAQVRSVAFASISAATLANEIKRLGDSFTEHYLLIDARYPYEYDGGHIPYAVNVHDESELSGMFFPDVSEGESSTDTAGTISRIPIFYCEYSQKRGPTMAHKLRSLDRCRNESRYPNVDYEEMYVLDKGYREFYNQFKEDESFGTLGYVEMHASKELRKFTAHRSRANKTRRAAGGQDSERMMTRSRRSQLLQNRQTLPDSTSGHTPIGSSMVLRQRKQVRLQFSPSSNEEDQ